MPNSSRRRRAMQHAITRAKERHGVGLTMEDMLALNQKIWDGDAVKFGRRKRAGERYFVTTTDGVELPVVYHTGFYSIVTVLDNDSPDVLRARAKQAAAARADAPSATLD